VQVIYVGSLPNSATETNLKELFDTFSGGEVHTSLEICFALPKRPSLKAAAIYACTL